MEYEEERPFYRVFLVIYLVFITGIMGISAMVIGLNGENSLLYYLLITFEWLVIMFFVMSYWKYSIEISGGDIIFGFGFMKKKIPLKDIVKTDIVNISSKGHYNYGMFSKPKEKLKIYAAFNGPALQLTVKNSIFRYIISTEHPNQLRDVLK
ncbi:hypothetical protein KKG41_06020 [Patescibacteria group bacterium]|nr:hypothetical protein [Patescibacteria group bacterium]MBU1890162.1 hypothetical protein [Patescibacteria group bacterium]